MGEPIWLVQPVSPELNMQELATRLGFSTVMGVVPPRYMDPGRLVLVMGPPLEPETAEAQLEDSKWVWAWRREEWENSADGYPFGLPDFDVVALPSGAALGDYQHASELPPWPEGPLQDHGEPEGTFGVRQQRFMELLTDQRLLDDDIATFEGFERALAEGEQPQAQRTRDLGELGHAYLLADRPVEALAQYRTLLGDPRLATNTIRHHRFNGACSAVRAIAKRPDDAAELTDLALSWLRADLEQRQQDLEILADPQGLLGEPDLEPISALWREDYRDFFEEAVDDDDFAALHGHPDFEAIRTQWRTLGEPA